MDGAALLTDREVRSFDGGKSRDSTWTIFADQTLAFIGSQRRSAEGPIAVSLAANNPVRSNLRSDVDRRARVLELLDSGKFEEAGIEALNLRDASRIAAARFMERLPSSVRAPKLTIDGEGDIVLAWDSPRKVFVTVEGQVLHAILDPGTPDSMHIDSLNFADGDIPGEVLKILPKG